VIEVRHAKEEINLVCTKPMIPPRIPESEAEEYTEEIEFLKMKNQELENNVSKHFYNLRICYLLYSKWKNNTTKEDNLFFCFEFCFFLLGRIFNFVTF
jgi:hypothetical protein